MPHTEAYPGLQAHSIGESYPFRPVFIGHDEFQIRNLITGENVSEIIRATDFDEDGSPAISFYKQAEGLAMNAKIASLLPSERVFHDVVGLTEFSFLVPLKRESTKLTHSRTVWDELERVLCEEFGGFTSRSGYKGGWADSTGRVIYDESIKYTVGVKSDKISVFRKLVRAIAKQFDQQCLYVAVTSNDARIYAAER